MPLAAPPLGFAGVIEKSLDGVRRRELGWFGGETLYEVSTGHLQKMKCGGMLLPGSKLMTSGSPTQGPLPRLIASRDWT